jgi:ectoine hydroxylase-related dioxygenase (phytanoyl-CoA dioxygenase family)
MLTMRLHLDPMTSENGPLSVVPGSHESDSPAPGTPVEIQADAGDVLFMRPLLTHASSQPKEGTNMHRRIIHFEFAASSQLADGFEWHDFRPITRHIQCTERAI